MTGRGRAASVICVLGVFLLFTLALAAPAFATPSSLMTVASKLLASDGAAGDLLGDAVAVSGDYAVVGAPLADDGGTDAGVAYVFVRIGQTWVQYQKLTADDGEAGRSFGRSVAISGSTIVVGAPGNGGETDPLYPGAAYVFRLSGTQWQQQYKLTAGPDAAAGDAFGASVGVSGDRAVVGAPSNDAGGTDAGSAYTFVRSGTTWTLEQPLVPAGDNTGDRFGSSVAISGDTIAAGAPFADTQWINDGSVYFFVRGATNWSQQGPSLAASDPEQNALLGLEIAISGDYAVVGVQLDDAGATDAGAGYVFARSGTSWSEQQKLTTPGGGAADDHFGTSVAIDGSLIVIGAPNMDGGAGRSNSGSAFVFTRIATTWSWVKALVAADAAANDQFGSSVGLANATAVIGAIYDDDKGTESGSAYVFGSPVTLTPVHRFYRPSSGTHFYTPSEAEKASVIANLSHVYKYEGVAYSVNQTNNNQWLYRFYNKRNGSHFYTASETEKANVLANLSAIYSYDGPTYKVSTASAPGKPPVYRFYNKRNGSHFYTASEAEKANVIANLSATYKFEGAAFWLGQ